MTEKNIEVLSDVQAMKLCLIMLLFHDIEASQEPFFSAVDLMGASFSKLLTEKFFNLPKVPKDVCQGSLRWSTCVLVFSS